MKKSFCNIFTKIEDQSTKSYDFFLYVSMIQPLQRVRILGEKLRCEAEKFEIIENVGLTDYVVEIAQMNAINTRARLFNPK